MYWKSGEGRCMGFDFYADIAERMVEARARKGWNREALAEATGWKVSRIADFENVKRRFWLEDVETLAKCLEVDLGWLIGAHIDCGGKDCRYLVWTSATRDWRLYMDAPSAEMAYFKLEREFRRRCGVNLFENPRARAYTKLVGVPVSDEEIKARYPSRGGSGDDALEPDETAR